MKKMNENLLLLSSAFIKQKEYWVKRLAGSLSYLEVIPGEAETKKTDIEGKIERVAIEFSGNVCQGLMKLSKESDISIYLILLTALKALIYRYTGADDIGVISPVYQERVTERTLNKRLWIREHVNGEKFFIEWLLQIRQTVLAAYENQDYPFERLMEQRFDTAQWQDIPELPVIQCSLANIHGELQENDRGPWLHMTFAREGQRVNGMIIFASQRFSPYYVEKFKTHYTRLLESALENVKTPVFKLSMLSQEEHEQLVEDFNNRHQELPVGQTVLQLFEKQAQVRPRQIAAACGDRTITYGDLNQKADALAGLLINKGVYPDVIAGILGERSIEMLTGILGIWKAGGAYLPIDPAYPVERIQYMLADSQTSLVLLASPSGRVMNPPVSDGDNPIEYINISDIEIPAIISPALPVTLKSSHLAYVIYTSGSTGMPKGVMIEQIGMLNHMLAKVNDLLITENSLVVQNASHTFDISVWQFLVALVVGGKTIIYPEALVLDPPQFLSQLILDQVTHLEVVPSYLAVLLDEFTQQPHRFTPLPIIYLLVTGEEVKPRLIDMWFSLFPHIPIVNAYGPTEASDDITHFIMERAPQTSRIPIGYTLQNFHIYIVDHYMALCPIGVTGEICVSGIGVGRGYLNNPIKTSESFTTDLFSGQPGVRLYKTGDLGRRLPDGTIEFFGRKDYQVKIRGFRIELGEIESRIANFPGVNETVVIDWEDERGDKSLCAFLVNSKILDIDALKTFLLQSLPVYMVPARFVILEQIPLTNNGKIDRKALAQLLTTAADEEPFLVEITDEMLKKNRLAIPDSPVRSGDDIAPAFFQVAELSPADREKVLYLFNATDVQYPDRKMVVDFFTQQALKNPDHIALAVEDSCLTYQELLGKVRKLAFTLKSQGVSRDTIVGLVAGRSHEMVIGMLAILASGGAYLPLGPEIPGERVAYMLKECDCQIILVDGTFSPAHPARVIPITGTIESEVSPGQPGVKMDYNGLPNDLAIVFFTSGTTGRPRGVLLENQTVMNFLSAAADIFQFQSSDCFLALTTISFDMSVTEILLPLSLGVKTIIGTVEEQADVSALVLAIEWEQVTILQTTPTHLQSILADPVASRGLMLLKHLLVGGERFPQTVVDHTRQVTQAAIYNLYGPTETTMFATARKLSGDGPLNIGKPIANSRVYILNSTGSPQPPGIPGELYIGGAGVARGYLNHPLLTAEKFVTPESDMMQQSPLVLYKTGDMAMWQPDGTIDFLGRIDHQVQFDGIRIEPGEIENHLLQFEHISEAAVVLKEQGKDKSICAYLTTGKNLKASQLREFLSHRLPYYMIPLYFFRLETMPITANGKLDRRLLAAIDIIPPAGHVYGHDQRHDYKGPENDTERQMVEVWSRVLGIEPEQVSVNANFFELGGNSLKATILISRMHKAFNVKLSLPEVFKTPTVKELSCRIELHTQERFNAVEPIEHREYYPLSSAQKRLYILSQVDGDALAFNMLQAMVVEEEIDRDRLERAFQQLIQRHEILRTSFHLLAENQEIVQKVQDYVDFYIHYREAGEDDVVGMIRGFVRPFDLEKAPLLRIGLIKLSPGKYAWLIDIHHIITDGTSNQVLTHDFASLYQGKTLASLPIQYKDYACWQNREKERGAFKEQADFWLSMFRGELPVLDLPTDYPRPLVQSFEGRMIRFHVGVEETQQLNEIARAGGGTLFMVVLAIYNIFLARLARQDDIVIGIPLAGRRHTDLEKVIGMFLSTLALRNFPGGEKRFRRFFEEIKERTLKAFNNQDYPFEELLERLQVQRDAARNPLYSVMLIHQNYYAPGIQAQKQDNLLEMNIKPFEFDALTSPNDITLYTEELDGELVISLEYCSRLFKEETMHRYIGCFNRVVDAVVKDAGVILGEIDIVSEAEKIKILREFNDTREPLPGICFYNLFEQQIGKSPHAVAVVHNHHYLTYEHLDREAHRLALSLAGDGVGPGSIIALYLERGIEFLLSIIGVFKTGGAYLPLEIDYPRERIVKILEDSGISHLISTFNQQPTLDLLPHMSGSGSNTALEKIIFLEPGQSLEQTVPVQETAKSSLNARLSAMSLQDLAYIIYTSGSTGTPKGVMIHQEGMINHLYAKINELEITGSDTVAQTASSCFDISVWQFLAALLTGGKTCIIDKSVVLEPSLFLQVLEKQQVTILETVPSLLTAFLQSTNTIDVNFRGRQLHYLRWMIPTGEALKNPLVSDWFLHYPAIPLVNAYGPTEASDDVTHYVIKEPLAPYLHEVPIGKPLQNLHIYILDDYLKLCPVGVKGEICVAGVGVGKGYLKDPGKTAAVFVPNPFKEELDQPGPYYDIIYKTGDIGYFQDDGQVVCSGRKDNQVKIRGFRIEPGEIESQLMNLPGIKEAAVIVKETGSGERSLCAYWTYNTSSKEPLEVNRIKEALGKTLPVYMMPAFFHPLERMPLTINGKIDRKALLAMEVPDTAIREEAAHAYIPPQDDIERRLTRIWAEHLELAPERIGMNDNFFELGGHSLKATVMIAAISKTFGIRVPLVHLFKTPTIRGLAKYMKTGSNERGISIEPAEIKELYDLSINQHRLWILHQKNPTASAYHLVQGILLDHPVDTNLVKDAIKTLIFRHESLRTRFKEIDGKVYQLIEPVEQVEVPWQYIDLAFLDENVKDQRQAEIFKEIAETPFDFNHLPLFRTTLVKRNDAVFYLVFNVHHIIADGWSMGILEKEFLHYYNGCRSRNLSELEPVPVQYKDFACWHNRRIADLSLREESHRYWRQKLLEGFPPMDLPVDFSGRGDEVKGAGYRCTLSHELKDRLNRLAATNRTTTSLVMFTAFNILLSYLLDRETVVCSIINSGRQQPSLYGTVGYFVNPVMIKSQISRDAAFGEILEYIEENTLEAFQHQDYPLEIVLEELKMKQPEVRVSFNMLNIPTPQQGDIESFAPFHETETMDIKFDIEPYIIEYRNGMEIFWSYKKALFKPATIEYIAQAYTDLLQELAG